MPEVRMLRSILILATLFLGVPAMVSSQDRSYGRSMVVSDRGIVASSHYLASEAGAQTLARGDVHIGFGIMGGPNQPLAHAQFVSNLVDYAMNIQGALEAPRFTVSSNQITCDILIESRVKPDVLQALRDKGHKLMVRKEYTSLMGRGQAVMHNGKTGMNFGPSDPRADGTAEPEPLPQNP